MTFTKSFTQILLNAVDFTEFVTYVSMKSISNDIEFQFFANNYYMLSI